MKNDGAKIQRFTDLKAWQEGHKLVLEVYKTTKNFPEEEKFGLTSQMRRCAVSITSNLAEGFSKYSIKDKIKFYNTSQGSLTELQNQLIIAKDVEYLPLNDFEEAFQKTDIVNKLINGLIRSIR
jgi:four helix bundle protein